MKKAPAKKIASDINSILSVVKPAKKKERWEVVCDLVDCWIYEEITKDELIRKLIMVAGKPIIWISEVEYKVSEWKNDATNVTNVYLECRNTDIHGQKSDWVQVEDLTELRVWEYNDLVERLHEHYPDYPIEYLKGRFV